MSDFSYEQLRSTIFIALSVLLVATGGVGQGGTADPDRDAYSFTLLATLGEPAPGGGNHINDFETGAVNNRGDVIYGTDLGTSNDPNTFFGEGVFLRRAHHASEQELARATANAPGGGVFDFLLLGQTSLNDEGDGGFSFTLRPTSPPF